MSVTDYISREKLYEEGFIHVSDKDAAMKAAFGSIPDIIDRRMDISEIARWLQVSPYRLKGYVADYKRIGIRILDTDGCLSLRQIREMDWSRLADQKRTPRISGSNYQGRKRKINKS